MTYSAELDTKIRDLMKLRSPVQLGKIEARSPLVLAPMAGICTVPFRRLMNDLGAGFTVSELVSCHGINHGNERTLNMLKIHKSEDVVGLQLFGEDPESMAKAALIAEENEPTFIDINMGCPVRKVVNKGGGSALLRDLKMLGPYLGAIKKVLTVPLTIKIRMGWDSDQINADEILHIAKEEGIEFVAIHGRTRAQQYRGEANWDYIETLAGMSPLPLLGNGDLHQPHITGNRLVKTTTQGLMIARGALRSPFIFLETLDYIAKGRPDKYQSPFGPRDYWEVTQQMYQYTAETFGEGSRATLTQTRKLIQWFAAGFPRAAKFRGELFATKTVEDALKVTEDHLMALGESSKFIDYSEAFLNSGHG